MKLASETWDAGIINSSKYYNQRYLIHDNLLAGHVMSLNFVDIRDTFISRSKRHDFFMSEDFEKNVVTGPCCCEVMW